MLPNITNKRFVTFGLQGSGKTELNKQLLRTIKPSLVYDIHHEYTGGFNRYLAAFKQVHRNRPDDPAINELNWCVEKVVLQPGRVRLFVLDEANRFCPNHYPLPSSILTLNDDQRHDKIAFGSIARRPAQLNTDLTELAHYLFIFRLTGRNDYTTLEDIASGMGDMVRELKDYEFVIVSPNPYF